MQNQWSYRKNTGKFIRSYVVGNKRHFQKLKSKVQPTPTGTVEMDFSNADNSGLIPLICPPV